MGEFFFFMNIKLKQQWSEDQSFMDANVEMQIQQQDL